MAGPGGARFSDHRHRGRYPGDGRTVAFDHNHDLDLDLYSFHDHHSGHFYDSRSSQFDDKHLDDRTGHDDNAGRTAGADRIRRDRGR